MSGARFTVLQRAATTAVVLLGFAAMNLGGALDGAFALVVAGLTLAALVPGRPRLPARIWLGLQLGFLAWLLARWLLFKAPVLPLFGDLLIFVQLHRVLTRQGPRDDLYSFFIGFGQLLLASILTFEVSFLLVFGLFMVALTWGLLLTRLALAVEESWPGPGPVPPERWAHLDPLVRWPWFVVVSTLNLGLLAATVALFFILPRMHLSLLSGSLLPPIHVSGFSEQVRLGAVGLLQLSDEPVLRVRATNPAGEAVPTTGLYWSGLALDRFDGRSWQLSDPERIRLSRGSGLGPPRKRPWSVKLDVTREPLDSDVLFVVGEVAGLYGKFRRIEAASTEGFHLPTAVGRVEYTVYARPGTPETDRLREVDGRPRDPTLLATYTQLPGELSPSVARLAREWTVGTSTDVDRALAIQQRLRTDFTYTLDQPSSRRPDPIEAFLTEFQEGHCEYFATAMALMLRSQGVPARIVNGFAGGEANEVGGYTVVRQRDGHSWVEVHFPEEGWVVFDPTPSASGGVGGSARRGLLSSLRAWADYSRVLWSEVMLDYGADNQMEAVRRSLNAVLALSEGDRSGGLGAALSALRGEPEGEGAGARLPWWLAVGLLVAGTLGLLALARPRRSPEQRHWDRLLARWQRLGRDQPDAPGPGGTLRAWAAWAEARDPQRFGGAQRVAEAWYAERFGQRPLPPADRRRLRELARAARAFDARRR